MRVCACTSSKGFRKMECVLVFPTSLACFPITFQIALCRQSILSLSSPPPFVSLMSLLFSAPHSSKARGVNCTLRFPQDHALLQWVNVAFSEFACLALQRISYAVTAFVPVSHLFVTLYSLFARFSFVRTSTGLLRLSSSSGSVYIFFLDKEFEISNATDLLDQNVHLFFVTRKYREAWMSINHELKMTKEKSNKNIICNRTKLSRSKFGSTRG